ncbi:MAG: hypothetical protein ACW99A_15345 [Candidatus Kariarchaeaceae archaeon]
MVLQKDDELKPQQEIFFMIYSSRRKKWIIVHLDNSQNDHTSFISSDNTLFFKNFNEFNDMSHGSNVNYEIRLVSHESKFLLEFILKGESIKSYNFTKL